MFLNLILSLGTAESIFSKGYKQMNGQVNIETDIFDKIQLTGNQRLIITLSDYNSNKLPLFLICRSSPSFLKIPDYLEINNDECAADLNSYDFQKSSQIIIIEIYEQADSYMNIIHQRNHTNTNIIVILEQRSDFFIKFEIVDKNLCYLKCQNQGFCIKGQCQCIEGYIGDDCSIQIFDLSQQGQLDPNLIYYLKIEEQISLRFDFYEKCSFLFNCISNYPFYKRGQLEVQSFIEISQEDSQKCIENINLQNHQFSLHQQSLYLFSTTNLVQIKSESQEMSNNNTIIYVVTSVGLSLLLIIIFACIIRKRRDSQIIDLSRNSLQMSQKIALIKQVNKFMPIQTYEQLITKFPGLIDDQCCPICLENYNKDHKIRVSYCTHFFHSECLDLWIEKNENCPTCRSSLNYETLNKLTNYDRIDEGLFQNMSSSKHINTYLSQQKIRLYGEIKSGNSPIIKI